MAIEVKIPPMGESITSGILANWRVKDGDTVKRDQPLFELETDKITSEGVAEADGVIHISVEAGTEVKIGQVVAAIDPAGAGAAAAPSPAPAPATATASAAPKAEKNQPPKTGETPASPAVRRIAEETGVDPASVSGTGKGGRVTKGDMLQAAEAPQAQTQKPSAPPPAPAPAPANATASAAPDSKSQAPKSAEAGGAGRTTRKKMSPLRAKIAERLVQAKNQTAMLTTFNEVDMTAVRELRAKYQDDFTKKHGVKLGFMSFFVKAAVHALKEVPQANAQLDGDAIVQNHFFDIGVAVSTERGLMVPVLRDCDTKSFSAIEIDLGNYAKRARDGKITLEDLSGGVFTITNGGVFGSLLSTPILNPPQSAILGMHSIQDRPVALNGQVVIRPMMYIALSYDHRVIDGKEAVTFLVKVKQAIEDPTRLVLGV